MGLGFVKVIGKSVGKALKDVGLTVASVGALAGLTALATPEVLAPLVAVLPSAGGSILLLAVPILVKVVKDAIKHRDKI